MEFDPIHKEEAMEMKISIDQSKSDPCLDLLLSSSDSLRRSELNYGALLYRPRSDLHSTRECIEPGRFLAQAC